MALARRLGAFALGLALGCAFVACKKTSAPRPSPEWAADAGSSFPVRMRDDRGEIVVVKAEPRRLVALLPSHTETLFALGVGARLVGIDDFSDDPPEVTRLPRLGGVYDAHLEAILALSPDLVLLSESSNAAASLERSGVAVWAGSARTFDDIFRVIDSIGAMVGRSSQSTELDARIRKDVANVEDRLRGSERVRVYFELDANLYTVGPASFVGVLLAKAGGDDIVPRGLGDFPKISPEVVISGNPSIIFGVSLEEVARRPGWSEIAAVRTGRVYKLSKEESRLVVHPGPRIADGLRVLARHMHPEAAL